MRCRCLSAIARLWLNHGTTASSGKVKKRPVMLSEKVREAGRFKHNSLRTEEAYLGWARQGNRVCSVCE
ncbi:MAG TPA: hypothetical protein PKA41_07090 [Verrucomicrobiota bacterium]|nr:hypothetical protein [Verrucomicrobiota bacterium]